MSNMTPQIDAVIAKALQADTDRRVGDAINILRDASGKFPNNDKVLFHLGRMYEKAKAWGPAVSMYQRVAEHHEKLPPDVALGMARSLLGLKRNDRALKIFEALSVRTPKSKDVLIGLATCKRHLKELDAAESLAKEALAIDPKFLAATHELAEILIAKNDPDAALALLEKNVFREDAHGDSIDLWVAELRKKKREIYLQEKLEWLTKKFPKKVEFVFAYGLTANRAGELTIARPALERANELAPNNSKILYELGIVERIAGNIERSNDLISRSLVLRPDFPSGLRTLGVDHKYVYGDDEFKRVNKVAASMTEMSQEDQIQMHYALAKAFDDTGELDAAFPHYGIGGEKKRKIETYNEKSDARMFQIMEKVVTREFFESNTEPRLRQRRTGVHPRHAAIRDVADLEQILSSHPDTFGAGELKFMTGMIENISVGPRGCASRDRRLVFDTTKTRRGKCAANATSTSSQAGAQGLQAHRRQDAGQLQFRRPDPHDAAATPRSSTAGATRWRRACRATGSTSPKVTSGLTTCASSAGTTSATGA